MRGCCGTAVGFLFRAVLALGGVWRFVVSGAVLRQRFGVIPVCSFPFGVVGLRFSVCRVVVVVAGGLGFWAVAVVDFGSVAVLCSWVGGVAFVSVCPGGGRFCLARAVVTSLLPWVRFAAQQVLVFCGCLGKICIPKPNKSVKGTRRPVAVLKFKFTIKVSGFA